MKKLTTLEFINRANVIHSNHYDYSKVEYVGANEKVCVICPTHGGFMQIPSNHLYGQGCPKCAKNNLTNIEFIEKARLVHGDKYDYSNVNYTKSKEKITIICPIHGEFQQRPNDHLQGQGCRECGKNTSSIKQSLSKKEFIERAMKKHNCRYDYSNVNYVNNSTKIKIVCFEHGEFWQIPVAHLNGQGCPKCGLEDSKRKNSLTRDEFIERSNVIHNNKYDYSHVVYKKSSEKVVILCLKHGSFLQTPNNHLSGHGCPICNESKLEKEFSSLLKEKDILFEEQKTFDWLGRYRLDFYLPNYNVAIECQGRQHFKPSNFGSIKQSPDEVFSYVKSCDLMKYKLCKENNLKIYYFSNYIGADNFLDEHLFHDGEMLIKKILDNAKKFNM